MDLPPFEFVSTSSAWRHCLSKLQSESRIAIDLESNSMHAYREEICLIQISIPDQDYIIDPLSGIDLNPFGAIIEDSAYEKILHASEYDLILLRRQFGWRMVNLFDTMWAVRILGYKRVGLASVLETLYSVKLNKRFQRADWCSRPLSAAMLSYAQHDTHFLLRLRQDLYEELEAAGRLTEAQETFAEQCDIRVPDISFDPESFWRVNGARGLSPRQLAVLRELMIFRDSEAERRNRPVFKVFNDKTLIELATQMPDHVYDLQHISGMTRNQIRRYGAQLLATVRRGIAAPLPKKRARRPRPPDDVAARYDILREWRKQQGLKRGVESDVIMSRDALWALAYANPTTLTEIEAIPELGPWRSQRYATELLQILNNSG